MTSVQDEEKVTKQNYQYMVKSALVKPENLHIVFVHQINDEIIIAEVNMLIDKVLSTVKQAKE
jgi:hypothetical protein